MESIIDFLRLTYFETGRRVVNEALTTVLQYETAESILIAPK
jgi:hypothetical protein